MITIVNCADCPVSFEFEHFRNGVPLRCPTCKDLHNAAKKREYTLKWRDKAKLANLPVLNPAGAGLVYVVSSPWIPGLVKIGHCHTNLDRRLQSSSIPQPKILHLWREDAPWRLETWLHARFRAVRVPGTEWFQITPEEVASAVSELENSH